MAEETGENLGLAMNGEHVKLDCIQVLSFCNVSTVC